MNSSQSFDTRLQELKQSDPTAQRIIQPNRFHDDGTINKKLCIAWDTGRKMFFHYTHFMTCDFDPNPDLNCITLEFMTRYVILKGYYLDELFVSLMQDEPHIITIVSERYAGLKELNQPFVTEAVIER